MQLTKIQKKAIELSISLAGKCKGEDDRAHPFVGVVAVKNNKIIASAYRGENKPGEHAEYTMLEGKMKSTSLSGCEVFTTLEPCNERSPSKIPCAVRLIDRKVKKVWIGSFDLDKKGQGFQKLRDANIEVDFYPKQYMDQIEEMNRGFITEKKKLLDKSKNEEEENKSRKRRSKIQSTITIPINGKQTILKIQNIKLRIFFGFRC